MDRIASYSKGSGEKRTQYVYDGRGNVIQTVEMGNAWYNKLLPFTKNTQVESIRYTPFGSQIGERTSGFTYGGEEYNADTGMMYLRMRYYEPDMNRFSQKDVLQGTSADALGWNRYVYAADNPVNFNDPSGMFFQAIGDFFKKAATYVVDKAKSFVSSVVSTVKTFVANTVNVAKTIVSNTVDFVKGAVNTVSTGISNLVKGATGLVKGAVNTAQTITNMAVNAVKTTGKKITAAAVAAKQQQINRTVQAIQDYLPGYKPQPSPDGTGVGIYYNDKFIPLQSAEQVKFIKACMDLLEKAVGYQKTTRDELSKQPIQIHEGLTYIEGSVSSGVVTSKTGKKGNFITINDVTTKDKNGNLSTGYSITFESIGMNFSDKGKVGSSFGGPITISISPVNDAVHGLGTNITISIKGGESDFSTTDLNIYTKKQPKNEEAMQKVLDDLMEYNEMYEVKPIWEWDWGTVSPSPEMEGVAPATGDDSGVLGQIAAWIQETFYD